MRTLLEETSASPRRRSPRCPATTTSTRVARCAISASPSTSTTTYERSPRALRGHSARAFSVREAARPGRHHRAVERGALVRPSWPRATSARRSSTRSTRILVHPEVQKRTPVILLHHPIHNPPSKLKTFMKGLEDADAARSPSSQGSIAASCSTAISTSARQCTLGTPLGELLSVGATSASLDHEHEHKMAGFNLYEFDDTGKLGADRGARPRREGRLLPRRERPSRRLSGDSRLHRARRGRRTSLARSP